MEDTSFSRNSHIPDGRVLEITTTTGCAVGCSYCPQHKFAKRQRAVSPVKYLTLEDFRRCLARVPTAIDIHFSGYSEPWLNRDCTEMVEQAHACGHGIRIYTTLVGMNERDLRRLQELPIKAFVVHLFDSGGQMNSRFVRKPYLNLFRQLLDADIPSVQFLTFGGVHPDLVKLLPAEALLRLGSLISRAGSVDRGIAKSRAPIAGGLTCVERRQFRNVLLPNGDITLCCMDFERRHVLGNLLRDDYENLFEGRDFRQIVDRMNGANGFLLCRMCEHARSKLQNR
ncbi:radical SAM/SPASM domain-containing protein [Bradyrhizobium sp. CCGE-LA001]|uniref:radical SAM/SPASM domain-containing protein n=1 Tax=Bradyrhizobium sp. CCGE-LA001 TaxID=1223566 RepID=UPI000745CE11|nr:radical SAM/SPASM domain-containing protein [Bradyrhizobium sp. CCGE-LA001]AMA59857.1 radical SAM protein [Bradyrhizobium sp. CCGE-LA001]